MSWQHHLAVSSETKCTSSLSCNRSLKYFSKTDESIYLQNNFCRDVHSSFIHNNQNLWTAQGFINRWYMRPAKHHSAAKMSKPMQRTIGLDLKNILLRESLPWRRMYCIVALIWRSIGEKRIRIGVASGGSQGVKQIDLEHEGTFWVTVMFSLLRKVGIT